MGMALTVLSATTLSVSTQQHTWVLHYGYMATFSLPALLGSTKPPFIPPRLAEQRFARPSLYA